MKDHNFVLVDTCFMAYVGGLGTEDEVRDHFERAMALYAEASGVVLEVEW